MPVKCRPNLVNEKVSTTGFTHKWVLDMLQKHVPEFNQTVNGHTVTSIIANDISGGQGYCSKIFKTCIFVDDQKTSSCEFIMKIPTTDTINGIMEDLFDENQQKEMDFTNNMNDSFIQFHNTECDFYETFSNKTKIPLPKVFYIQKFIPKENQPGVIVMEDMSKKLAVLGIYPSLNVFQIKNIVSHLAEFHAENLANEMAWKNKFPPYYNQDFSSMHRSTSQKLVEFYPGMFDSLMKKFEPVNDLKFIDYQLKSCCEDLDLPTVISFGDLWTNNIFFERKEDNIPNKVLAFVDFQIAFEGSIATDVSRVITMGCDAEDRRAIEPWICEFYYDQLTKYMGKKPNFNVEKFKTAYEYAMLHHTSWLIMFSVIFASKPGLDEVGKAILDAKMQKLALRTKFAMEDCVKILEKYRPDLIKGA